jgi:hypothetical protein
LNIDERYSILWEWDSPTIATLPVEVQEEIHRLRVLISKVAEDSKHVETLYVNNLKFIQRGLPMQEYSETDCTTEEPLGLNQARFDYLARKILEICPTERDAAIVFLRLIGYQYNDIAEVIHMEGLTERRFTRQAIRLAVARNARLVAKALNSDILILYYFPDMLDFSED